MISLKLTWAQVFVSRAKVSSSRKCFYTLLRCLGYSQSERTQNTSWFGKNNNSQFQVIWPTQVVSVWLAHLCLNRNMVLIAQGRFLFPPPVNTSNETIKCFCCFLGGRMQQGRNHILLHPYIKGMALWGLSLYWKAKLWIHLLFSTNTSLPLILFIFNR